MTFSTKARIVEIDMSQRSERNGYAIIGFRVPYSDYLNTHQDFRTMSKMVKLDITLPDPPELPLFKEDK